LKYSVLLRVPRTLKPTDWLKKRKHTRESLTRDLTEKVIRNLVEEQAEDKRSDRMVETDKAVTTAKETVEIHQAEIQKLKKPKEDAEETDIVRNV
jgi:uncharacterized protein HemY